VQRFGVLGRCGDVCLHHVENEEVVFADDGVVMKAAFEAGVAICDQRRVDLGGFRGRQAEMLKLVDLGAA
jgi:hypothetical protein